MKRVVRKILLTAMLSCGVISPLFAQDDDLRDLRLSIEAFAGVLEDALGLNQSTGLFGISLGGTESTYLQGQGAVIEVRSPLANQRNRLSMASLSTAMQSLAARNNPFEAMRRQTASESLAATAADSPADSFYNEMMERIASVDFSLAVNSALQQAGNAARSLRSLDEIDTPTYESVQSGLDDLRDRVSARQNELRQLQNEIRSAVTQEDVSEDTLSSRVDTLLGQLEPLRNEAEAAAEQLNARMEQASQRYAQQWQQEFVSFEEQLYTAMCDFGASLRELPDNENISVILVGLGEDGEDNRRTDKVHIYSVADLRACQRGNIDAAVLQERASAYSY
ncbi:MAG: hypothetical protein RKH07_16630 [Gammaproteobacteria bacterium]